MEYLKMGQNVIAYELYKSSKAKRVSITIKQGQVRVAVPTGFTFEYAKRFLEEHKEWVFKNFLKQDQPREKAKVKHYVTGERLPYRGRNYPLIINTASDDQFYAVFSGSRLLVYTPAGLCPEEQSQLAKELITKWYVSQAHKYLPELVDFYAKQLGICYKKLKIKDQKTRWGSCSNKGNINLNWRIIMAPNQVVAYVIIHELCHLRFMNHSQDFWNLVATFLPDYKQWKNWLSENSHTLLD